MGLLKDIGLGVATGGAYNINKGIYDAVNRTFGTDGSSVTQVPLRTPEEEAAQKALLAQGMAAPNIYGGSFGDFNMSGLETESQGQLSKLLASGDPQVLHDLLNTDKYDPTKTGGAYDMMQGTIDRQIRDATTAAKRSSAYTGNLYSSDAVRSLGDVQAKGLESKNSLLGGMYQNYVQQKIGAAPTLESIQMNRIGAGYTAGALPRNLKTASDQAKYQEWVRANEAKTSALKTSASTNTQWGVPTVTTPGTSGWENLLNIGAKVAPWALMAGA